MFDKHSSNSSPRKAKLKTMVELVLTDGRVMTGEVFLAQGERLIDILNDGRGFLPLELVDGEVMAIAKSMVATGKAICREPAKRRSPHAVLRVPPGASMHEVRDAWRQRIKACHPDRIAAMNLDETIEYAARKTCQQINAAYDEIVTEHKAKKAGTAA